MQKSKFEFLLLLALLMFVAKPFVGFNLRHQHYFQALHHRTPNILVKSFSKHVLGFSENGEFGIAGISKKLADPVLPVIALLAFALNIFLPRLFKSAKAGTYGTLAAICYNLGPPQPLYLLGGKLTI